jgi:allophanate hydrolase subunit 1
MFDPGAEPAMPVAVGDSVRFEAIDRQRYLDLGGEL